MWNMASVALELYFNLILTNLKLNLNSHIWLEATLSDSVFLGTDWSVNLGPRLSMMQSKAPRQSAMEMCWK